MRRPCPVLSYRLKAATPHRRKCGFPPKPSDLSTPKFRIAGRSSVSPLLVLAYGLILGAASPSETRAGLSAIAEMQRLGMGGSSMWEPLTGSLLVDYYEAFLRDRDLDQFKDRVLARYTEGTLGRVLTSSASVSARRAAVLALGVFGRFDQCNTALGRAMRDTDPVVRTMAESALWAVWFRADSPENNETLDEVRLLIGHQKLDAAVALATKLIARAPIFAEAYNQRAIALFIQGKYARERRGLQTRPRTQPLPHRCRLRAGPVPAPAQPAPRGLEVAQAGLEAPALQPVATREHPGPRSTDRAGRVEVR